MTTLPARGIAMASLYVVEPDDTLSAISARFYGNAGLFPVIDFLARKDDTIQTSRVRPMMIRAGNPLAE